MPVKSNVFDSLSVCLQREKPIIIFSVNLESSPCFNLLKHLDVFREHFYEFSRAAVFLFT